VQYQLLGQLRVFDDAGVEVHVSAPKLRMLLAVLLVHHGQFVPADRIAYALWGDAAPPTAANLIQGYVRDLRHRLGAESVVTVPRGYRLDIAGGSVDIERFEDLLRARLWPEALDLWHGAALEEWCEQPWARAIVARLEEQRSSALESRLADDIEAGLASAAVAELTALVEQHPLRERLRVLLVKALYAAGRQADALSAYTQARHYLLDEVGLEPGPELRAVEAAVLAQDPSLAATPPRPAASPPAPVSALVGRERELAMLRTALTMARLVTLAGPGGVGKTRLAVELAAAPSASIGAFWFIELAAASASTGVAATVARALQLADSPGHETERICDYLSRRHGALVLDTCEHVVEPTAELATHLLARCPDLRIVATSREPLRAPGEQIIQLGGLDEAAGADLFTARARAVNATAALDDDQVRTIVDTLEGLPLALELAAARTTSLSLEQLLTGLAEPLELLAGETHAGDPRHRTMRAVIGWSYDLLDERDREAFAALSVYAGSFDREAASAVVGHGAPHAVDQLLGRSLLTRDRDLAGQARYRFLDPVRQFAHEQATLSTRERSRRRHLDYYVALAARIDDRIRTAQATQWAAIARACTDDLRAAVNYAIAGRAAAVGRFIADLYWPWFLDGHLSEMRSWASVAIVAEGDAHVRARLLRVLASTAIAQGDTDEAVDAARRQLDTAQSLQDVELVALAHNLLGMAAWARGDYATAREHHRAALANARRSGPPWNLALIAALAGRTANAAGDREAGDALLRDAQTQAEQLGEPMVLGIALDYRAHAQLALGRTTEAAILAARSLAAYRSIGYQEGLASAGTLAAHLALVTGDHEQADTLLREALDVSRRLGHIGGTASVIEGMAVLHHDRGDYQLAAVDLAEAHTLRRRTGTAPSPALQQQLDRVERSLAIDPPADSAR
jgi:predicted ATPase/DNA-binding SARP family transcriptional activator